MQDLVKNLAGDSKQRSSNFELYRILCMLAIVAHHFEERCLLTLVLLLRMVQCLPLQKPQIHCSYCFLECGEKLGSTASY